MIPNVHVEVETGPLYRKAAENEFASFHGPLPGAPATAHPEIVLSELGELIALPGGGVEKPLLSHSHVGISERISGIISMVGQGTEMALTQVWLYRSLGDCKVKLAGWTPSTPSML